MLKNIELILAELEEGKLTPDKAYSMIYEKKGKETSGIEEGNNEIAVIGLSCRFPNADTMDAYWDILSEGKSCIKAIPKERWDFNHELEKKGIKPTSSMCRVGGFLKEIENFDAAFFDISNQEACLIDPQQRLLLEVVQEGIEHAGYCHKSFSGSNTGIFIGARDGKYEPVTADEHKNARVRLTGTLGNFNAARISNYFNLKGPSLVYDTACSSSLISTHYACKSILAGECDMAIAGGVHLCVNADTYISLNLMNQTLSKNGKCYAFDRRAEGFVPGEGVGIVVLKPLNKAIKDRDTIYAVIKGSAVNNDGYTIGETTPDLDAEQQVLERALQDAKVDAATISLIEAHGTGTMIGDPIEVRALAKAFNEYTDKKSFCALGSVKTNIGHLDTAAGIASLIKVILALYYKKIPPTQNIDMPNPRINFVDSPFYPAAYLEDWKPVQGVRRAGVNSFGFGGTNCHMILEEGRENQYLDQEENDRSRQLFLLSAKSGEALEKAAETYANYLAKRESENLGNICYTTGTSRRFFDNRLALICSDTRELKEKLKGIEFLTGECKTPGKVTFLFTGQGALYSNLAKELYERQPVFKEALNSCDRIFNQLSGTSLLALLYESDGTVLKETAVTQPVTFAVSYALARMWMAFGVTPEAVLGHSAGEYAAACIAGTFSLEDGLKLITWRGKLMQEKCRRGAMAALMCSRERAEDFLKELTEEEQKTVSIGAHNGETNTVISGEQETIAVLIKKAEAEKIRAVYLEVSHGFHSPMMLPMLRDYEKILEEVDFRENQIPIINGVTGERIKGQILSKEYWLQHVLAPVNFYKAIKICEAEEMEILLEVGAGNILSNMAKKIINKKDICIMPTLVRGVPDWHTIQEAMASLYVRGVTLEYEVYDKGYQRRRIALPTYPFNVKKQQESIGNVSKEDVILSPKPIREEKYKIFQTVKAKDKVEHLLMQMIAKVSTVTSDSITATDTFLNMGLDSNSLIYIASEIEKEFHITFVPSAFFEYQSIEKLAEFLTEEYGDKLHLCKEKTDTVKVPVAQPMISSDVEKDQSEWQRTSTNDIAVIGMAGQFPEAENLEIFWDNLKRGMDCVTDIPASRLDLETYYNCDKKAENKTYLKRTGLLKTVELFDPEFFNISPKEAKDMDPQQRLLLQGAYHTLESGGYAGDCLSGSDTGIFVGVAHTQYKEEIPYINTFTPLGNHEAMLANRLSYFLNFNGPSMVVNTQCSSSLVAVHLACKSILNGECTQALAGGVMAVFNPIYYLSGSKLQAFSLEGKCKTFDKQADGYVPGEGYGMVLLKPLKKALEDSDKIFAVIKGSAVNHGGKANNVSAPNAKAQEMVINGALANAGLTADDISYIEAHGTGTVLGDPVEIRALTAAYQRETKKRGYCGIGSLKSNIGHLESAAGIAGIIKVILSMQHKELPPTIHFNQLNPFIDILNSPFYINDTLGEWKCEGPRRAGVSSFGMGGTNAHIILEEAPVSKKAKLKDRKRDSYNILTLSAKHKEGLEELAVSYKELLKTDNSYDLQDICYSAGTGRGHYEYRLALVADTKNQAIEALGNFVQGMQDTGSYYYGEKQNVLKISLWCTGNLKKETCAKIMVQLYQEVERYQAIIDSISKVLEKHGISFLKYIKEKEWFLREQKTKDEQVWRFMAFVYEYALGKLLEAVKIIPAAIGCEEEGVYTAACLTGFLDVEEAVLLLLKDKAESTGKMNEIREALREGWREDTDCTIYLGYLTGAESSDTNTYMPTNKYAAEEDEITKKSCNLYAQILTYLYAMGADIDWRCVYEQHRAKKVELPLYPFRKKSFWLQKAEKKDSVKLSESSQPDLWDVRGASVKEEVYDIRILKQDENLRSFKLEQNTTLNQLFSQHKVQNEQIMPATGYVDIMLFLLEKYYEKLPSVFKAVTILDRITYEHLKDGALLIECEESNKGIDFSIYRRAYEGKDSKKTKCVTGKAIFLKPELQEPLPVGRIEDTDTENAKAIEGKEIYRAYEGIGMDYGNSFKGIQSILISQNSFVTYLHLEEQKPLAYFHCHQGMLDSGLQSIIAASLLKEEDTAETYFPFYYQSIAFFGKLQEKDYICYGKIKEEAGNVSSNIKCDINIYSLDGKRLIAIEDFTVMKKQKYPQTDKKITLSEDTFRFLYGLRWEKMNLEAYKRARPESGKWLVFSSDTPWTASLIKEFYRHGQNCIRLSATDNKRHLLERLKQEYADIKGIIYNGVSDTKGNPLISEACFYGEESTALRELFQLAKSLADHTGKSIDFITISGDAMDIENKQTEVNPLSASLWGLTKVMDLEIKNLKARCIDFDLSGINESLYCVSAVREIIYGVDKYVLYSGGNRYISGVYPLKKEVEKTSKIRANGVYLITGGLGDIALETGKYLAKQYQVKLAFLTRTALPDRKYWEHTIQGSSRDSKRIKAIQEIEALGSEVKILTCDVTKEEEVKASIDLVKASYGRINGVFHMAGIIKDRIIIFKSWEDMVEVMAPKVIGGELLCKLLVKDRPDFMVWYSSISAITGNLGQGDYAAANAYLDALASKYKSAHNIISINWTLWEQIGMGTNLVDRQKANGVKPIRNQTAMEVMEYSLLGQYKQVLAANLEEYVSVKPIKEEAASAKEPAVISYAENRSISPQEAKVKIAVYIVKFLCNTLEYGEEDIGTDTSFSELGIDSILGVELIQKIEEVLKVSFNPTIIYDYPNIALLSEYIAANYLEEVKESSIDNEAKVIAAEIDTSEESVLYKTAVNEPIYSCNVIYEEKEIYDKEKSHDKKGMYDENATYDKKDLYNVEDIAIIGMSYTFPGMDEEKDFLQLLAKGDNGIKPFPKDRGLSPREREDKEEDFFGGYIEKVYDFDPLFFNITPKEAELMDPQQRKILKITWEAVEIAGYANRIQGSETGVFIGISTNEYQTIAGEHHSQVGTGNALSIAANRISYFFDLKGPSLSIDTACSSSLVAVDAACANIRLGNCEMAIAGGVNLILTYNTTKVFKEAGMLSRDGKCKTFDNTADGYVRGEGCGAVLLKPLKQALLDRDNIVAVIKGSAVNQDGHTNGLTAPNGLAQEKVIRKALKMAEVNPEDITYIEAHGTGTPLGDPIELRALTTVFRDFTDKNGFCAVGSLKTNIGHLEPASGIASLIKVILSLKNKVIFPSLHFNKLNNHIEIADSPFYFPDKAKSWSGIVGKRRAGVSSFGFGGTNAHVILEEAPECMDMPVRNQELSYLFTVSAGNTASLFHNVEKLYRFLQQPMEKFIAGISYTLTARRKHFSHRIVFLAKDMAEIVYKLEYILSVRSEQSNNQYGYSVVKTNKIANTFGSNTLEPEILLGLQTENPHSMVRAQTLEKLIQIYLSGEKIEWENLFTEEEKIMVPLPAYGFHEERYFTNKGYTEFKVTSEQDGPNEEDANTSYGINTEVIETIAEEVLQSDSYSIEALTDRIGGIFTKELINKLNFKESQIDIDSSLMDYGFDSIFAVSAVNLYEEKAGIQLDPTILFDFASIREFSLYLAKEYTREFQRYFSEIEDNMEDSKKDVAGITEQKQVYKEDAMIINDFENVMPEEKAFNKQWQEGMDIAVIGYAGRFPKSENISEYWENLKTGFDGISSLPKERYTYGKAEKSDALKQVLSGYVRDAHSFDPLLFNISGKEADYMDPQQRLMLEVVWETLEQAGYNGKELSEIKTGVFIGASNKDYSYLISEEGEFNPYMGTGNALSVIANRISYSFNLKGPSMAIDTACSSSLVAIHLACQSLKTGECQAAIAGGVNLLLDYDNQAIFEKAGMIAKDYHCKTYDESANGYVRAEGVGAVLLKPLTDARRDGDTIHAVIKGTGVNQDGKSNGLTVPNAKSQIELLCETWERAGIQPQSISYLENHGTGTSLGDPIEIRGITEAFKRYTDKKAFCAIGSVKSNIGHLEPASGIAGILKVILAMKYGSLPPTIHFRKPNKKINFTDSPIYVNDRFASWQTIDGTPRRAGISSFGFGGTNAHIVLEEPQNITPEHRKELTQKACLFTLSGRSQKQLQKYVTDITAYIRKNKEIEPYDLCYTLATGRQQMGHTVAVCFQNKEELLLKLGQMIQNQLNSSGSIMSSSYEVKQRQPMVFMYTGQGSQYKGAGYELYKTEPVFKSALDKCEQLLMPYINHKLTDLLYAKEYDAALLNQTNIAQPLIFSFGYALTNLLKEWGIRPDIVMGHSVGEYVAAVTAGILSLEDGMKLIAERGRIMNCVEEEGQMYAVFADVDLVKTYLKEYSPKSVSIAAINTANNVVISGASDVVRELAERLTKDNIKVTRLAVSNAFHSPIMNSITEEFRALANTIGYKKPAIPIVSNVDADIFMNKTFHAEYLVKHLLQPVKFMDSIKLLYEKGYRVFVEIAGGQTLVNMCKDILKDKKDFQLIPTLRSYKSSRESINEALGQFYTLGCKVDWNKVYFWNKGRKIPLPPYPFDKKTYWFKDLGERKEGCKTEAEIKKEAADGLILKGKRINA
ncbi:hypothetical protein acsn021_19860 [Anaerocolumna cellulosilytica]|uniref:Uncharacterized protein n=1 Tax=Anaerocolumna cellulosilytica TaxID=433286 RepID=A0A6S6R2X1_9FIRM|nr:type I polyketide synthase [Anaerocolumna cellulosilytica]MBB5196461.1 acyl transferase domain-containing protein/NADP-dependent 3-hydroxy acid dehydrogenase YdfG [Anaerocolumna cellulosilytica]BCJ94417.1 hypothetical protein acsn021_19860 [Anaerocolumna cellulosilytica]